MSERAIEAAAEAMMRSMFAPHELPLCDELIAKYRETARAALAAAQRVGEDVRLGHIQEALVPLIRKYHPVWCSPEAMQHDFSEVIKAALALSPGKIEA